MNTFFGMKRAFTSAEIAAIAEGVAKRLSAYYPK